MKNATIRHLFILLLLGVTLAACRPDDFYPLGERLQRETLVTGSYTLLEVHQTDLDAKAKGFPDFAVQQDVSNAYPFSTLQLNIDANGNFTVDSGSAPNVIGLDGGTWAFDNEEFPSRIEFSSGGESTSLGLRFINQLDEGRLILEKISTSGGQELTEYLFHFQK